MSSNFSNAQKPWTHQLGFGVLGTRQSLVNYLDYGFQFKKYRAEIAFGYDLGRLVQYQHFAPSVSLGFAHQLIDSEKTKVDFKTHFLNQRNMYPSNNSLVLNGLYAGYELRIGSRIQFSQRLLIGLTHSQALSGYSKMTHDFILSAGVNYVFANKNSR